MNASEFNFSVLISVYNKENSHYFNDALESIYNQTLKPEEVILVKDGPLTEELDKVIVYWEEKFKGALKTVNFDLNVGLARALNEGLRNCSFDLVARMDSDDISRKDRFEKQIGFLLKNHTIDVLGSYILEYDEGMTVAHGIRKVPLEHDDIVNYCKWRNPMNHMSVVFRKNAVLLSGGYKIKYFEDYCLWAEMIMRGYKFANIPETLITARAGKDFIKRRRGIKYFGFEVDMLKYFRSIGFFSPVEYFLNFCIRFCSRILPVSFLSLLYKFLRKKA